MVASFIQPGRQQDMLAFEVHFAREFAMPSPWEDELVEKNGLILGSIILDWRAIKDWNVTDDRRMLVSIQAHFEPTDIHSATKNSKSIFGVTQNLPCCMSCHPSLHPPTLSLPFLQTCSTEKVWGFALFASIKAQGFPTAPSRSFPVTNQHWKGFASRKKPATKHHFRGGRIPVSKAFGLESRLGWHPFLPPADLQINMNLFIDLIMAAGGSSQLECICLPVMLIQSGTKITSLQDHLRLILLEL